MASRPLRLVAPRLDDPRVMLALGLTTWTVLGQTSLYFNRNVAQIGIAVGVGCLLDMREVGEAEIAVDVGAYLRGLAAQAKQPAKSHPLAPLTHGRSVNSIMKVLADCFGDRRRCDSLGPFVGHAQSQAGAAFP